MDTLDRHPTLGQYQMSVDKVSRRETYSVLWGFVVMISMVAGFAAAVAIGSGVIERALRDWNGRWQPSFEQIWPVLGAILVSIGALAYFAGRRGQSAAQIHVFEKGLQVHNNVLGVIPMKYSVPFEEIDAIYFGPDSEKEGGLEVTPMFALQERLTISRRGARALYLNNAGLIYLESSLRSAIVAWQTATVPSSVTFDDEP